MPKGIWTALFLLTLQVGVAQQVSRIAELEKKLKTETNHSKIVEFLLELSELYEESNPENSLRYAQRALTISKNTNDYSNTSKALLHLGKIERREKNYDLAIEVYYEALASAEKALKYNDITNCFIEIAHTYLEQGKYELADEFLEKARKVAEKTNDPEITSMANLALAHKEILQKKYYLASEYLDIALENASRAMNKKLELEVILELARLQRKIDEQGKAKNLFLNGLDIAEQEQDKYYLAIINYELGELYQQQAEYDNALIHMRNSLNFAQEAGLKAYIKKGYQNLSDVYVKNGDYKRAYEYLRYYDAVKDAKEISELEDRLAIEAKEREIQLLNKQREFDKEQQKTSRTIIILLIVIIITSFTLSIFLYRANRIKNTAIGLLQLAKENAEKSEKEKETFLTYISHEMRTPLNAIVGFSKMLAQTELNSGQKKHLQIVQNSAENILLIVNDVLDLSKIESGAIALTNVDFNLAELIDEIIQTLQFKVNPEVVELKLEADPDFPAFVKGDPVRIRQIILNLADNAVKFTENGYVTIHLQGLEEDENKIKFRIKVEDTGTGIRSSKLKNIFNRYEQESANTTRKYGGTGLGLAITKQLVEIMGGTISVSSVYGQGSLFSIELTLKKSKNPKIHQPTTNKISLNNLKILLVDDNALNREIFIDAVESKAKNVSVSSAEDGRMAIGMLIENDYDVVLMDIQMPRMNGFEATKHIRTKLLPPKNSIPIIAMTAHALEDTEAKAKEAGMDDYVTKPVNFPMLFKKVEDILKSHTQTEENQLSNSPTSKINITLEHLNWDVITELTGGKNEKIEKYLNLFLNNANEDLAELKKALDHEDWNALSQTAHKLKGSVAYLGAKELVRQLKEAETFNKGDIDFEYCEEVVHSIDKNMSMAFMEAQLLLKNIKKEDHDS